MKNRIIFCTAGFVLSLIVYVLPVFAFEPPAYDIEATVNTSTKKLSAQQTVKFTNNFDQDIKELFFYIYPHRDFTLKEKEFMLRYAGYFKVNPYPEGFDSGSIQIASTQADGKPLEYEIAGKDKTLLKVLLVKPVKPGESVEVKMNYVVTIPHAFGRFGWHEDLFKMSRWYPILAVYNKEGWVTYPTYPFHRPFFNESANYSVRLTVPSNQVVIHSGKLQKTVSTDNGATNVLTIQSVAPIREFTFAMSPRYKLVEGNFENVKIKSFYLPGDEESARRALQDASDLMKYYTKLFGPYPYEEFSIAPVYLGYGGEQMSNMIFIDTRAYQLPHLLNRHFDFLIAHETGHQWFYNLVGTDEYTQMWMEEGINSYFIQEYLVDKYGKDAEVLEYPDWFKKWQWTVPSLKFSNTRDFRYKIMTRIGYDGPVIGDLASFQEPSSIFALTYGKGSRILAMLKARLGEEKFNQVFAKIFKEFRYKNLGLDQFIQYCEEVSDDNLESFFDQWLYTAEHLDYAITQVRGNRVTVESLGGIQAPVELEMQSRTGQKKTVIWQGDKERETIVVEDFQNVAKAELDPEKKLLDIDRTNNNWPRQIHFKPVPLYFGLYDIPVFMEDDAYNVVVGPEINQGVGLKAAIHKPYDQMLYGGSDYEFGEELWHSRAGYRLNNLFQSQTALGFEVANTTDYKDGDDDVVSGKLYLRKELWPAQYGLGQVNDHVTLYLIRNQGLGDKTDITSREDDRNYDYSRRKEAIVGTSLTLDRSGPYPDPSRGAKMTTTLETAGHYLEATQSFNRGSIDVSLYKPVTLRSKLATRLMVAGGFPADKELFYLGGIEGLRGFERKSVRGANGVLGGLEYRFPLKDNLHFSLLDNLFSLQGIQGVAFYDGGQAWFSSFSEANYRQDAGLGLRLELNVGSFLEKVLLRMDVARPINGPDDETRVWFGVNQAF